MHSSQEYLCVRTQCNVCEACKQGNAIDLCHQAEYSSEESSCLVLFFRVCDGCPLQARRAASVKALTDGHLLTLTRKNFDELLGSLADIRQMWRFEALGMASLKS